MLIDKSLNGAEEPGKLVCCQFFLNILNSSRGIFQQTEHENRQRICSYGSQEKKKKKKKIKNIATKMALMGDSTNKL